MRRETPSVFFSDRQELPELERLRRSRDAPESISQLVPNALLRASANKTLVGRGLACRRRAAGGSVRRKHLFSALVPL